MARQEVAATIAALPAPLRERAAAVPVILGQVPGQGLLEEGVEPDTLGLFSGPEFAFEEQSGGSLPARIDLFLANIWDEAGEDEAGFREEVRTTYLHELGHYLGLDEDDLFDRGLD